MILSTDRCPGSSEMTMFLWCVIVACVCGRILALTIEVPECHPPDAPESGSYGPKRESYSAGDVIHYYCDVDTHIGGNFYRRCEDTGHWTGNTPVCDQPQPFSSTNQSSTAAPLDKNDSEQAVDNLLSTCSQTRAGVGETWFGMLETPGQLFRVMVYLPKMEVNYEVFMVKRNGAELSCGSKAGTIGFLNWEFHNCPGPNNVDIVAVRIRSKSNIPLRLCQVQIHTLTDPTCDDPHVLVDYGHLRLSRKRATLKCDDNYINGREDSIECVRTGVWNRKNLYCTEKTWETNIPRGQSPEQP